MTLAAARAEIRASLPTRERANLILEKASDHRVRRVRLRKR